MNRWRRVVVAAGIAFGLLSWPTVAEAGLNDASDPAGDVEDQDGAAATDDRVDIRGVVIENELETFELRVTMEEVVPFDGDAWSSLVITGILAAPDGSARFDWNLYAIDGDAFGTLTPVDGFNTCFTEASQTGSTYVLNASGACVDGLPRTVEFAAEAILFGDETFVTDRVPDTGFGPAIEAAPQGETERLAGTDRILTAIELSQDSFADGEAFSVVLAASGTFPDALAGGPLAFYRSGPLLLTGTDSLDARVATEIERVLRSDGIVYILGGTAALSDQVQADVQALGFDELRLAGVNRFETAVAIAEEITGTPGGAVSVLIADGRTFTDALIAGAAAPRSFGVVVLTDGTTMPDATAAFLDAQGDADQLAIGMAAAAAAPSTDSIEAPDAASLSVAVADQLAPIRGAAAVASAANFPDSLAGGPHIALAGGPLLLTAPNALSAPVRDAIDGADDRLREITIYGGTAAVSAGVQAEIDAALVP